MKMFNFVCLSILQKAAADVEGRSGQDRISIECALCNKCLDGDLLKKNIFFFFQNVGSFRCFLKHNFQRDKVVLTIQRKTVTCSKLVSGVNRDKVLYFSQIDKLM